MNKCIFYECRNRVEPGRTKCVFHRNRMQCTAPNCRNQAYARGRCVRHGARKTCRMEECNNYRRAGGYCARHTTERREQARHCDADLEPLRFGEVHHINLADWEAVHALLVDNETSSFGHGMELFEPIKFEHINTCIYPRPHHYNHLPCCVQLAIIQ